MIPSLLLHSCCAPCSTYCIEVLSKEYLVTVFYYNPNIFPQEEYKFRKAEQKRFIEEFPTVNPVRFLDCDYEKEKFYDVIKGLENEPERGARCVECFKLRLGMTAKSASKYGFDYFATTLTISPQKDAKILNEIGKEMAETYNTNYLESNFKKKNGYLRSTEISKEYKMYRQNFCGCEYSLR